MILNKTRAVGSGENRSVEKEARTESHNSVGSHGRSLRRNELGMGSGTADDDKLGRLFKSVIGSFPRDDYVMHVALTQASAADADKAGLLLKFRNRFRAPITHTRAKPPYQLLTHLSHPAPITPPS